jgi:hypothetical protein
VYQETVTEPKSLGYFASSAALIEQLFANGTVEVEEAGYSDHQVSDIVDKVRACIAKKARKPVHMVERADLQIVAVVASHAKNGDEAEPLFRDNALKHCLESVLNAQGIFRVTVTDSSHLSPETALIRARLTRESQFLKSRSHYPVFRALLHEEMADNNGYVCREVA